MHVCYLVTVLSHNHVLRNIYNCPKEKVRNVTLTYLNIIFVGHKNKIASREVMQHRKSPSLVLLDKCGCMVAAKYRNAVGIS